MGWGICLRIEAAETAGPAGFRKVGLAHPTGKRGLATTKNGFCNRGWGWYNAAN